MDNSETRQNIGKKATLAVKWDSGKWTHYRVEKYRKFNSLVNYFTNVAGFRFAILYERLPGGERGKQIGYFSKKESWINT